MAEKKYYWLKLKRDFFKRHDIRIIEELPNGKEYILFYMKLLLESIDHEGELRFSETIPYNEQMLSVITNTNIDIVRNAMKVFIELNMMTVFDDQTIYMAEVEKLIGSETKSAERVRNHRQKLKALQCNTEVTNCNTEIEKDIDKDAEIDKEEDVKPQKRFKKPTLEEIEAYCRERNNNVNAKDFYDYYEAGQWKDAKGKPVRNWKQKVITWERSSKGGANRPNPKPTFDYDQFTE